MKTSSQNTHGFEAPHGEQVCHHGAEPGGEAGLGDEAELELRQADHVITLLPVPARDVQKIRLESIEPSIQTVITQNKR